MATIRDGLGRFVKGIIPWNKNSVVRVCEVCEKEFEVSPYVVKKGEGKYCSKSCFGKIKVIHLNKVAKRRYGKDHFRWIDGKGVRHRTIEWYEIRKKVLKRDNYMCIDCGEIENLQVHHLIPWRLNDKHEMDNLITLCVSCHTKREHKLFKQYKTSMRKGGY